MLPTWVSVIEDCSFFCIRAAHKYKSTSFAARTQQFKCSAECANCQLTTNNLLCPTANCIVQQIQHVFGIVCTEDLCQNCRTCHWSVTKLHRPTRTFRFSCRAQRAGEALRCLISVSGWILGHKANVHGRQCLQRVK